MFKLKPFLKWLEEVDKITPHTSYVHKESFYEHTIAVAYAAAQEHSSRKLFIASLLHDIGKPTTLISMHGNSIFYFHEMHTEKVVEFLDEEDDDYTDIIELINYHMLPYRMKDPPEIATAALSVFADLSRTHDKEFIKNLLALYRYDVKGTFSTPPEIGKIHNMREVIFNYSMHLKDIS